MDEPRFTDLDDDLFPFCTRGTVGALHTDEYGVVYVCDLIEELGYVWVALDRSDPRPE